MKNNETIKMGFWKRLKISIFNVENYDMFAVEKISKALGYFIKLIIIFSLIVSIGLTYKFSQIYTTTTNILKDQIPDFQYSEGKLILNTQHPVIIENEEALLVKIIVDDTEDIEKQNEYKTQIKKYPSAILFLKNNILINLPQQEEILEYSYEEIMKEFAIKEFNKQEVIEYINNINLTSLSTMKCGNE